MRKMKNSLLDILSSVTIPDGYKQFTLYNNGFSEWVLFMKKILNGMSVFFKKASEDSLAAYAAQVTFFVLLSFFPFVFLVVMITSKISLIHTNVIDYILRIAPAELRSYIYILIDDIVYSDSYSFTIITVLVSLWSLAMGIQSLSYGLDKIYCVERKKNFFVVRLLCSLYTLVFIVMSIFIMTLHVYGTEFAKKILEKNVILSNATFFIVSIKGVVTFTIIFVFLLVIYYQLPGRKGKIRYEVIGAATASLTWLVMTKAFSFYIRIMTKNSYMYGSLTSVILILIWLYVGMQIILYGAEINYFLTQILDNNKKNKVHK